MPPKRGRGRGRGRAASTATRASKRGRGSEEEGAETQAETKEVVQEVEKEEPRVEEPVEEAPPVKRTRGAKGKEQAAAVAESMEEDAPGQATAVQEPSPDAAQGTEAAAVEDVPKSKGALTLADIEQDPLTQLAEANWAKGKVKINKGMVSRVLNDLRPEYSINRTMVLELSNFLEKYLWPLFDEESSSDEHVWSIVIMVNEKCRENIAAWDIFDEKRFPGLFARILALQKSFPFSMKERGIYTTFFINAFQSIENRLVREQCLRLTSLPMWKNIYEGSVERALTQNPSLGRIWQRFLKKEKKKDPNRAEVSFMTDLIAWFLDVLGSCVNGAGKVDMEKARFCERFLELMIDLLAQQTTRRFFLAVVLDKCVVEQCDLSELATKPQGRLFRQMLEKVKFYVHFSMNEHTGQQLSQEEASMVHYDRVAVLQRLLFKVFEEKYMDFVMSSVQNVDDGEDLRKFFASMPSQHLRELCQRLKMFSADVGLLDSVLVEALSNYYSKRPSQLDAINALPLYPNEHVLWDHNVVPSTHYSGETTLAIHKLNLQYLTFQDYLQRNFNLYRLESTYEVREDIDQVMRFMAPRKEPTGKTSFHGWAKMALPIQKFRVSDVSKPNLGEHKPAYVLADITYNAGSVRGKDAVREWMNFRQHDVLFLVAAEATVPAGQKAEPMRGSSKEAACVKYIRGAEVLGFLDIEGNLIPQHLTPKQARPKLPEGLTRTVRVMLDAAQYQLDDEGRKEGLGWPYTSFNLIVRRDPEENNFKAVLECVRDVMNADVSVPGWLNDVLLGYGDPAAAHYSKLSNALPSIDFFDTFVDEKHAMESFPGMSMSLDKSAASSVEAPMRVRFDAEENAAVVAPYRMHAVGPYPQDKPKMNTVRFTPMQVEAIRSAVNPGLSIVVGPPGTGKTDVAVQSINNLYHTFTGQRILLITHSNQALNDIFEKIMVLDIDERHLLRLGHGQEALATEKDFSKWGRVNYMLAKRLELLEESGRLAGSLGLDSEPASRSCESAGHFFLLNIVSRWEEFVDKAKQEAQPTTVIKLFPFTQFFANAPQPIFNGKSFEEDMRAAEGCFGHLRKMHEFLDECRTFEVLRTYQERANYLVTTQAKIIAMTCTHAALKRHDFVRLDFEFDTLIMEEAAQVLEVETFIPLMLQKPERAARLKRLVLIGDHNQLPPVVQNMAFQKFARMDQSMFARLVRLGVKYTQLNFQGRTRPSIASLFNWRYENLGDMPHVVSGDVYKRANAGLAHEFQFVDVGDFHGSGETSPRPFFYQNLGEAEYIAAVYMYMRLLGYPAEKISILTTYNGQKYLLRDVLQQRCGWHPRVGMPAAIETVDKFQGQQNDYILLSMVRTKAVGHVRDIRRLVVAMSRARLGLYVFGRAALFRNCFELRETFTTLLGNGTVLKLVENESFPCTREVGDLRGSSEVKTVEDMQRMVGEIFQKLASEESSTSQNGAEGGEAMAEDVAAQ